MNLIGTTRSKKYAPNVDLIEDIHEFCQRDDVSRASPNDKDVKTYKLPHTNEEVLLPKRHMILTIKESYAIFIEERKDTDNGLCYFLGNSTF